MVDGLRSESGLTGIRLLPTLTKRGFCGFAIAKGVEQMPRALNGGPDPRGLQRFKNAVRKRRPATHLLHHLWRFATVADCHPLDVVPNSPSGFTREAPEGCCWRLGAPSRLHTDRGVHVSSYGVMATPAKSGNSSLTHCSVEGSSRTTSMLLLSCQRQWLTACCTRSAQLLKSLSQGRLVALVTVQCCYRLQ